MGWFKNIIAKIMMDSTPSFVGEQNPSGEELDKQVDLEISYLDSLKQRLNSVVITLANIKTEREKEEAMLSHVKAEREKEEFEFARKKRDFIDYINDYERKERNGRDSDKADDYKSRIHIKLYKLSEIKREIEKKIGGLDDEKYWNLSVRELEEVLSDKLFNSINFELSSITTCLYLFGYNIENEVNNLQRKKEKLDNEIQERKTALTEEKWKWKNALEEELIEWKIEQENLKHKKVKLLEAQSKMAWTERRINKKKKELHNKQNSLYMANLRYEKEMLDVLGDKEDLLFIFKSLKKVSPLFRLITNEMSKLITDETSKEIFISITQGDSLQNISVTKGISFEDVCERYEDAIKMLTKHIKSSVWLIH